MMYSSIVKSPAFPLGIRVSSQTKHFKLFSASKLQSLVPNGSVSSHTQSQSRILGFHNLETPRPIISCSRHSLRRSFSDLSAQKADGDNLPWLDSKVGEKARTKKKDFSRPSRSSWEVSAKKLDSGRAKSSWEESVERLEKAKVKPTLEEDEPTKISSDEKPDATWQRSSARLNRDNRLFPREEKSAKPSMIKRTAEMWQKSTMPYRENRKFLREEESSDESTWQRSAGLHRDNKKYHRDEYDNQRGGDDVRRGRESESKVGDWINEEEEDTEDANERRNEPKRSTRLNRENRKFPRDEYNNQHGGYNIRGGRESRSRFPDRVENKVENEEFEDDDEEEGEGVYERGDEQERFVPPEWERRERWGRKIMREASESSVPKMVGEALYGVGPVLAALSSGRREFYALYVQERKLNPSNNNKTSRKKDQKGFETILQTADELGVSLNHVSKHDLNMVVDSRPHQGLILDASPLEMVKILKLDRVVAKEDERALWVALDEVMDPQNLGAIVRSAYFFGATGVVLCAKNSAPLSGVVSKASAGSLELMELRYCKNMMQFLTLSAENGWRVIGGSVSPKAVPVNEIVPGAPTILVLGSEGKGLRPLVEKSCTGLVRIPSNVNVDGASTAETGGNSAKDFRSFLAVESLNVSVAAGVLLHHFIGDNYYKNNAGDDEETDTLE